MFTAFDYLTTRGADVANEKACELARLLNEAREWIENGDWSNGVTDPTGSVDQGLVSAADFVWRITVSLREFEGMFQQEATSVLHREC
jgi:hypothetical protein